MKELNLSMDVVPKAIQSVSFSRFGKYQPAENVHWKNFIKLAATQQLPQNFQIFTGAVELIVRFTFPPLKSFSKKKLQEIETGGTFYKTTKPDLQDNLMKGLCDALTGVIWNDDAQICIVNTRKVYGKKGNISIIVREIDE